jgi:subtilase family serine protease
MITKRRRALSVLVLLAALSFAGARHSPDEIPDLKITDLSADWEAYPGERIDFAFSVENAGDKASGSCYYGVYISTGAYWVGDKLYWGYVYSLDPGRSDRISGSAELPADIEPGYYYLYAVVDDGEYEDDSDRSNNVAYQNFQVLEPEKDPE